MRFAIATVGLLIVNCKASTDEAPANNNIQNVRSKEAAVNKKILSRDNTQIGNRKGMRHWQFGRRLASKKKERELKLRNMRVAENGALRKSNHADPTSPDLGIIGQYLENSERRLRAPGSTILHVAKESIMDKNSMRESSDIQNYAPVTNNSTSSQNTFDDENDEVSNKYDSFFLGNLQYNCDSPYCDCGDFDVESYTGTIECQNLVNTDGSYYCESTRNSCGESIEICYRETFSLEAIDSETYSYTSCYANSKPYQQHVCITFDHTVEEEDSFEVDTNATMVVRDDDSVYFRVPSFNPCSVTFNNMECNYCSTEISVFQQYSINEKTGESEIIATNKDRCFNIDCSNVGGDAAIVNTCEDLRFPNTLKETVMFGDDCTRCQPCGLGYRVQNLDAEGVFPVIGEYMCSGLELAAKTGFFNREMCPEVKAKTEEYCGCEPIFYDPDLTQSARMGEATRSGASTANSDPHILPSILLPGDTIGDKACDVCGVETAIVAQPNAIVTLPNGVSTSCSALQGAGRLGMFTSDYCRSEVMPLVFRTCGGCFRIEEDHVTDPVTIVAETPAVAPSPPASTEYNSFVPANNIFIETQDNVTDHASDHVADTVIENIADTVILPIEDNVTTPLLLETPPLPLILTQATLEAFVRCRVCPEGSMLGLPDNVVAHSELLISCRAFGDQLANAGAIFTTLYCKDEVGTIIDNDCGGCVAADVVANTTHHDDGVGASISNNDESVSGSETMSARMDTEGDRKPKPMGMSHSASPEELDVDSTKSSNKDEAIQNVPNSASSVTEPSSSGAPFTKPRENWLLATTVLALSVSCLFSLS